MKNFNFKKIFRGILLPVIVIAAVSIPSCYYDYGLNTDNYDVVGTFYNTDYNFSAVNKFYLKGSVIHIGGNFSNAYDALILEKTKANLLALGWTEVAAQDSATADVIVSTGVTTTTNVVNNGGTGCWYDYWGYTWCYPSYSYSYTYTTGTIVILMGDKRVTTGSSIPAQWNALMNGLAGESSTGNPTTRITNAINKAFSQSPYLKN
ncbi:MAG: DUF4136 domain-containing protein [Ignavibacteria bacterium]|nr:DUF4136 domain-containing protein [Ignavibacteria bacterium]MBK7159989.1 DUF4136 domain-containing protein [Ignavibacteria bacterium]MBK8381836.1 DUF4136 domain-containing protein [Ignavibacteria bacterium]MBK9404880.1 DUF4136 domain-containing protein [Ignavibacteria bacterium]